MLAPAFIAIIVTLYWLIVSVKVVFIAPRLGKLPNVLPKEKMGLFLRLIWAPTVLLWMFLPWCAVFHFAPLASPFWQYRFLPESGSFLPYLGVVFAFIALLLSLWCWREMGQSWRIGIDPAEQSQLVVSGPFRFVLHPIYSLSILLMLSSFLVIPTVFFALIAFIHITLLIREALREELYLDRRFPETYAAYRKNVGRFIPKYTVFFAQES